MTIYKCFLCNRQFNKKNHLDNHLNKKKKPCCSPDIQNIILLPNLIENPPKTSNLPPNTALNPPKTSNFPPNTALNPPKTSNFPPNTTKSASNATQNVLNSTNSALNIQNDLNSTQSLLNSTQSPLKSSNFIDILLKEPKVNSNNCVCMYCEKIFTRMDNLQRHLNGRCKSKGNYDELEKLKEEMKVIIQNYQKMENNYQNLENENLNLKNKIEKIDEVEIVQVAESKNNESNIINNTVTNNINNINNNNSQTNKGVIINNVQLVQFGSEDVSKLNLVDAMKSYLKSTGGNIASSMLKYINLNEQYPENNNICMTDLSREIVKIHDGKKFVYKKFKNVKDDILNKIVKNTRKIVNNYEINEKIKKSADAKNKIKINEISLKIIDGISAEDIVREEIKEQERQQRLLIKNKNLENDKKIIKIDNKNGQIDKDIKEDEYDSESEEEREFTLEERLRIEHLENKRNGMQKKTFENIKDELYNARELVLVGNNNSFA